MRRSSFSWAGAFLLSCSALLGCGSDPPVTPQGCTPACSAGYTCSAGMCVILCNPSCGAGEVCRVRGLSTTCEPGADDGGLPDATVGLDASPQMDAPLPPSDTIVPPSDVVTPPTDAVTPPTDGSARPPCGAVGQGCCPGFVGGTVVPAYCSPGGTCTAGRCVTLVAEADECTATATCPNDRVCSYYGSTCEGGARVCLRCTPPPAGGLAAGAACGDGITGQCVTGVCVNSRCSIACVPGAGGNEACRRFNPRTVCSELSSRARTGGVVTTFGACVTSCERSADCPTGLSCALASQTIADTLIRTCRSTFGTIVPGGPCAFNPMPPADASVAARQALYCNSDQCSGNDDGDAGARGYCSAFCATNADCPAAAPNCREIGFFRPSDNLLARPVSSLIQVRWCER